MNRPGLLLAALGLALPALAATYHLDPVAGRLDHDGSAAHPWPGLQQVVEAARIYGDAGMPARQREGIQPSVSGSGNAKFPPLPLAPPESASEATELGPLP